MPKIYNRKTQKGADNGLYTRADLERAVRDVNEGHSTLRGAAKHYSIPRTTIRHYIKGTRGSGIVSSGGRGGGGKYAISEEDQNRLAEGIKSMEKWGCGLSRTEIMDIVQSFVKVNSIKTRFKDDRPGEDWFLKFKARYNLSIKKPQGVEYVRMAQVNPFVINDFYNILDRTIKELNIENKPHSIFNLDETSFSTDPSKTKVVGERGVKSTRMISSAGRENTSVLICCSASGNKLPPLCIFKGKTVIETYISRNPDDQTSYAASKRGWMDSEIFYRWFEKCFLRNIPEDRPVLVIYDGHASHINYKLAKLAVDNNVTILKLPPHTTHVLQPLDVAFFKPFKSAWDKELCAWQRSNPLRKIPKNVFVDLLNKVYNSIPSTNILSGFKKTGIYDTDILEANGNPVNKNTVKDDVYRPDDLKRYRFHLAEKNRRPDPPADIPHITGDLEPVLRDVTNDRLQEEEAENIQQESLREENIRQDSQDEVVEDRVIDAQSANNIQEPSKTFDTILLGFIKENKENIQQPTKRRRLCTGPEIITTKESIDKLKKRDDEENAKNEKRKKNESTQRPAKKNESTPTTSEKKTPKRDRKDTRKRKASQDSSTSEDSIVISEYSDSEGDSSPELREGDFVIVSFQADYYPGEVLSIEGGQVTVKHMEKSGILHWRWPKEDDILEYREDEILKIISPPRLMNNRGMYKVPAMADF